MSKIKIYNGSSWVIVDGGDCNTLDNLSMRVINKKIQYSSDDITWNEIGMDNSTVLTFTASTPINVGQTVSVSTNGIATPSYTSSMGVAITSAVTNGEVKVCVDGVVKGLSGLIPSSLYYADTSSNLTENALTAYKIGIALSTTELLLILSTRWRVL
jgi:hypothetical protein